MYFLQEKSIIYRSPAGHIRCTHFDSALPSESTTKTFAQTSFYEKEVSAISETLNNNQQITEAANFVVNTKLFSRPGLIKAIIDKIGIATKIQSDLEFVIRSQNLEPGKYSLIDISENESYQYNFVIDRNDYSLLDKTKLDNGKLKQLLANSFASTQADILFSSLLNYSNVVDVNELIAKDEIAQADLAYYTLLGTKLDNLLDCDLAFFFEALSKSIHEFVNPHCNSDNGVLIKSALTGFQHIKSFLSSNAKFSIINELDLLNNTTVFDSPKCKNRNESFELNCYPTNQTIVFPFSSWILSETGNLSLELLKCSGNKRESLQINLIDLKEHLSNTSFLINDKPLVKYFVEFEMDTCNNIHFKIETLNKEEFYYLINE